MALIFSSTVSRHNQSQWARPSRRHWRREYLFRTFSSFRYSSFVISLFPQPLLSWTFPSVSGKYSLWLVFAATICIHWSFDNLPEYIFCRSSLDSSHIAFNGRRPLAADATPTALFHTPAASSPSAAIGICPSATRSASSIQRFRTTAAATTPPATCWICLSTFARPTAKSIVTLTSCMSTDRRRWRSLSCGATLSAPSHSCVFCACRQGPHRQPQFP